MYLYRVYFGGYMDVIAENEETAMEKFRKDEYRSCTQKVIDVYRTSSDLPETLDGEIIFAGAEETL